MGFMRTGEGRGGEQLARPMIPALAVLVLLLLLFQSSAGEWLRGDLHCHSLYSDGDSPVGEIIARAESNGLDFLVITDHDSDMNGTPLHWFDPEYRSERMILLYGVEWTTGDGHANVWSSEPFPYDDVWRANLVRDADAAVDAAHAQGALFSINHPVRNEWEYPIVKGTDCVEIWNGPMRVNQNFKATREFWENILLGGRRVTGVGGSDTHNLNGVLAQFTDLGNPTTWVYAEEKNGQSILDGIARVKFPSVSAERQFGWICRRTRMATAGTT